MKLISIIFALFFTSGLMFTNKAENPNLEKNSNKSSVVNNEVREGVVIRSFKKLQKGNASVELSDLPTFLNVKDKSDGSVYESYPVQKKVNVGDVVKYYKKEGNKIEVIEEKKPSVPAPVINKNEEIFNGTVTRFFRKFTFDSGSSELNDLPKFVDVKDKTTGKVYESLPLKNYFKEGEAVKFVKRGDKIEVIEN